MINYLLFNFFIFVISLLYNLSSTHRMASHGTVPFALDCAVYAG